MRLQKLSDFVIEQDDLPQTLGHGYYKIMNYAKFLQTPLTIGMFVTCIDGKPVEEPDFLDGSYDDNGYGDVDKRKYKRDLAAYQKAKEAVLFSDFKIIEENHNVVVSNGRVSIIFSIRNWVKHIESNNRISTVEDLASLGVTLTPYAVENVLGLE